GQQQGKASALAIADDDAGIPEARLLEAHGAGELTGGDVGRDADQRLRARLLEDQHPGPHRVEAYPRVRPDERLAAGGVEELQLDRRSDADRDQLALGHDAGARQSGVLLDVSRRYAFN